MALYSQSVSHQVLLAMVIFTAVSIAPSTILAKKFIVGDEAGWETGIDYEAWAKGKTFCVGDTLVFQYAESAHNVYKVTKEQYQNCEVPTSGKPALTSGYYTVKLKSPGKKWYLCGVSDHCSSGQKLEINVKSHHHH